MIAKKNSTTRSRIRWSADQNVLYFDGQALKMNDWKRFIEELISAAEELLSQCLLFHEDRGLSEVDLKVIDDPSNHEAGYYFALDESDSWTGLAIGRVNPISRSGADRDFPYLVVFGPRYPF